MFTSSPSCASLNGGYSHLAPMGLKTYSIMSYYYPILILINPVGIQGR
jgi:hypothetical protein